MITAKDITDSMVDAAASQVPGDAPWVMAGSRSVIAAAVNAYLAENPACANGAELLAKLELLVMDRHIHKVSDPATYKDECGRCGQDLRSIIHYRHGEDRKTDLAEARALIAKAKGGEA